MCAPKSNLCLEKLSPVSSLGRSDIENGVILLDKVEVDSNFTFLIKQIFSELLNLNNIGMIAFAHVFSSVVTYKNTKSEKTNKHTIWLIYPTKRFEHMLFSKK